MKKRVVWHGKHMRGNDTVDRVSAVLKDIAPTVKEEAQALHWSNKNGKLARLHPWRALESTHKNTRARRAPENAKASRYSAGKCPYWGNVFPALVPEAHKG